MPGILGTSANLFRIRDKARIHLEKVKCDGLLLRNKVVWPFENETSLILMAQRPASHIPFPPSPSAARRLRPLST
jgi:hypothetical protein